MSFWLSLQNPGHVTDVTWLSWYTALSDTKKKPWWWPGADLSSPTNWATTWLYSQECSWDVWTCCSLPVTSGPLSPHPVSNSWSWSPSWSLSRDAGSAAGRPSWSHWWRCQTRMWRCRKRPECPRWRPTRRWLQHAAGWSSHAQRKHHLREGGG